MIVLNFSHPLTAAHLDQLATLLDQPMPALDEVRDVPAQFDNTQPFAGQVAALVDSAGLSPRQWQTEPILINPPGLAPAAAALIAELHGRMGHFPTIMRMRPIAGVTPPQYEVAEVLDLQDVREVARVKRHDTSRGT